VFASAIVYAVPQPVEENFSVFFLAELAQDYLRIAIGAPQSCRIPHAVRFRDCAQSFTASVQASLVRVVLTGFMGQESQRSGICLPSEPDGIFLTTQSSNYSCLFGYTFGYRHQFGFLVLDYAKTLITSHLS
jgi:hypothetical protein